MWLRRNRRLLHVLLRHLSRRTLLILSLLETILILWWGKRIAPGTIRRLCIRLLRLLLLLCRSLLSIRALLLLLLLGLLSLCLYLSHGLVVVGSCSPDLEYSEVIRCDFGQFSKFD